MTTIVECRAGATNSLSKMLCTVKAMSTLPLDIRLLAQQSERLYSQLPEGKRAELVQLIRLYTYRFDQIINARIEQCFALTRDIPIRPYPVRKLIEIWKQGDVFSGAFMLPELESTSLSCQHAVYPMSKRRTLQYGPREFMNDVMNVTNRMFAAFTTYSIKLQFPVRLFRGMRLPKEKSNSLDLNSILFTNHQFWSCTYGIDEAVHFLVMDYNRQGVEMKHELYDYYIVEFILPVDSKVLMAGMCSIQDEKEVIVTQHVRLDPSELNIHSLDVSYAHDQGAIDTAELPVNWYKCGCKVVSELCFRGDTTLKIA